jgi:hypothetical protein
MVRMRETEDPDPLREAGRPDVRGEPVVAEIGLETVRFRPSPKSPDLPNAIT